MNIPELNNLIKALQCDNLTNASCQKCPYGYGYLDESGDYSFWCCNEIKLNEDSIFYLKLYQHLIEESENDTL